MSTQSGSPNSLKSSRVCGSSKRLESRGIRTDPTSWLCSVLKHAGNVSSFNRNFGRSLYTLRSRRSVPKLVLTEKPKPQLDCQSHLRLQHLLYPPWHPSSGYDLCAKDSDSGMATLLLSESLHSPSQYPFRHYAN